jgi:sugar lactone lactonase YvrE
VSIVEIPATRVEAVVAAAALCGEGPLWDHRVSVLRWVDLWGKALHSYDPATGKSSSVTVPEPLGAVALGRAGGLVLALRGGFWRMSAPASALELVADVCQADPRIGLNDGRCDSVGRFWAGTAAVDDRPGTGTLHRLDRDGSVAAVVRGVTISNGLDWSPDDRTMYYVDTATRRIDMFDYDPIRGELADRRPFVPFFEAGLPDGLTVDAEGFVWVALFGGGCVHRYSPGGKLDLIVQLPVSLVTSCAFGGSDRGDLYITSASHRLSAAQRQGEPLAGALFRLRGCGRGRHAYICAA